MERGSRWKRAAAFLQKNVVVILLLALWSSLAFGAGAALGDWEQIPGTKAFLFHQLSDGAKALPGSHGGPLERWRLWQITRRSQGRRGRRSNDRECIDIFRTTDGLIHPHPSPGLLPAAARAGRGRGDLCQDAAVRAVAERLSGECGDLHRGVFAKRNPYRASAIPSSGT